MKTRHPLYSPVLLGFALVGFTVWLVAQAIPSKLNQAITLYDTGRYAEATNVLNTIAPAEADYPASRCYAITWFQMHCCWRITHAALTITGFRRTLEARFGIVQQSCARGDFMQTDDGFLCVNRRLHNLLILHRVSGVRFKPIGKSDWFVVNITRRVPHDRSVYEIVEDLNGRKYCARCKRPTCVGGIHEFERQISKLPQGLTVFTTQPPRISSPAVFLTEGVIQLLVKAKIKGGLLAKLLNSDEERTYKASVKAGKERWPPHSRIRL